GVKAGGGFIEDEDRCIFQESARQCETLSLSTAETRTTFADNGLVFFRKGFDEFMQVGGFRGFDNFCLGRVWLAQTNIRGKRVMEEMGFLRYPGHLGAPGDNRNVR